jgi:hypothetical protein
MISESANTDHLDRDEELARVDTLLDLLNDPKDNPRLVLQRASELVGSLVDSAREELGEQVSVGGICKEDARRTERVKEATTVATKRIDDSRN